MAKADMRERTRRLHALPAGRPLLPPCRGWLRAPTRAGLWLTRTLALHPARPPKNPDF